MDVKTEIATPLPPTVVAPKPPAYRRWMVPGIGGAVVLIAAAIFFWPHKAPPPPPRKAVTPAASTKQPTPAATTTSTPAATSKAATTATTTPPPAAPATGIAHIPINSINKARAVANAQGVGAAETDAIVASTPTSAPSPSRSSAKPTAQPAANVAVTELAPGVSATTATEGAPEAGSAFRTFVTNLHVSGVRSGAEPRAFINNRLVRKGEVVDSNLGITFEGVEGAELVFKDRSGAVVKRRY